MRQIPFLATLLLFCCCVLAEQVIVDPVANIHATATKQQQHGNRVMHLFTQIAGIPRCSYAMDKISKFVQDWATQNRYLYVTDDAGNILVQVPATSPSFANAPKACLQSHMDMVCEKSPHSKHDFTSDGISLIYDGDFVKASDTTLGADNGIGMALSMAVAEEGTHGPLELLFTVDEEVGLEGAAKIKNDFLSSKYLINLDSGEVNAIVHYCAGGRTSEAHFAKQECDRAFGTLMRMRVTGLKGGHSGGDIHLKRGNAIRLLGSILDIATINEPNMQVVNVTGGSAVNAIPRDAEAYIVVKDPNTVTIATNDLFATLKKLNAAVDPDLSFSIETVSNDTLPEKVLCSTFVTGLLKTIKKVRNGVIGANGAETVASANLGVLKTLPNEVYMAVKHRATYENSKKQIAADTENLFQSMGATVTIKGEYSGWEPKANSTLLEKAKQVFVAQRQKEPIVKGVHGGLEAGIIGSKHKNLDMISISPEIMDAHSPSERLQVSTVKATYDLLDALLQELKE